MTHEQELKEAEAKVTALRNKAKQDMLDKWQHLVGNYYKLNNRIFIKVRKIEYVRVDEEDGEEITVSGATIDATVSTTIKAEYHGAAVFYAEDMPVPITETQYLEAFDLYVLIAREKLTK